MDRYSLDIDGQLVDADDGEYVSYAAAMDEIERLRRRVAELEAVILKEIADFGQEQQRVCETCGGTGEVQVPVEIVVPVCCGCPEPSGECCGCPEPDYQEELQNAPCPHCVGKVEVK